MLFLVRSAFWLGMVYSAMPFDNSEQTREVASLRAALAASVAENCSVQAESCLVLKLAASDPQRRAQTAIASLAGAGPTRPSANSLTKADLALPWRGRPAKAAHASALAQRPAMPI